MKIFLCDSLTKRVTQTTVLICLASMASALCSPATQLNYEAPTRSGQMSRQLNNVPAKAPAKKSANWGKLKAHVSSGEYKKTEDYQSFTAQKQAAPPKKVTQWERAKTSFNRMSNSPFGEAMKEIVAGELKYASQVGLRYGIDQAFKAVGIPTNHQRNVIETVENIRDLPQSAQQQFVDSYLNRTEAFRPVGVEPE